MHLSAPGHTAYGPLLTRLFKEIGKIPSGPGKEMDRLLPALEALFASLLRALEKEEPPRDLSLHLEADEIRVQIDLEVEPVAGEPEPPPLLNPEGAAMKRLEKAFDEVTSHPHGPGGLKLTLLRHIPC